MSDLAIQVQNVSKLYQIGQSKTYRTVRESLMNALRAPARWLQPKPAHRDTDLWALKDVSFDVRAGEVVGVIGRNGAGKSTLLKVLSRITEPTLGRITLRGRVGSLLEVGTGFHPELTGRENIFLNGAILGMRRGEIAGKFDEIVEFSEVGKFIDTPVKHYSSGMYMRLAFAVAAHLEPEILIVDEVLAVGDAEFQKKCLGKMKDVSRGGRTVLFVSHNMSAIAGLCSNAILLDRGTVVPTKDMADAIGRYTAAYKGTTEAQFDGKALTRASIVQENDHLVLTADYHVDHPLRTPTLGFVISDHFGTRICGSSPLIDNLPALSNPSSRGSIRVVIDQPKLANGVYRLSLWFGDGTHDFFSAMDCLLLEVLNMTDKRQPPTGAIGPVVPVCNWTITPQSQGDAS